MISKRVYVLYHQLSFKFHKAENIRKYIIVNYLIFNGVKKTLTMPDFFMPLFNMRISQKYFVI